MKKYKDEIGDLLKPLVVETTGGWHPESMNTLAALCHMAALNVRKSASLILNKVLVKLSCALQKYHAVSLVRRCLE